MHMHQIKFNLVLTGTPRANAAIVGLVLASTWSIQAAAQVIDTLFCMLQDILVSLSLFL